MTAIQAMAGSHPTSAHLPCSGAIQRSWVTSMDACLAGIMMPDIQLQMACDRLAHVTELTSQVTSCRQSTVDQ